MWHGFGSAETFKKKNEILLGHCEAVGRNPGEIERTWGIQADALDTADDLVAAGVQHLIVGIGGDGRGYDLGAVRELIDWRNRAGATA
jgi:hypothetical protein